jgi:hypothetical protein
MQGVVGGGWNERGGGKAILGHWLCHQIANLVLGQGIWRPVDHHDHQARCSTNIHESGTATYHHRSSAPTKECQTLGSKRRPHQWARAEPVEKASCTIRRCHRVQRDTTSMGAGGRGPIWWYGARLGPPKPRLRHRGRRWSNTIGQ